MKTYRAHYQSPRTNEPVNGQFEFESESNAGSKKNMTDARIKMLEMFGNQALSWMIDRVDLVKEAERTDFVQLQLDFREPKKVRRHHTFERGRIK